jgi:hypothetical protein
MRCNPTIALLLVCFACDTAEVGPQDGSTDASARDADPVDANAMDASAIDASAMDAEAMDAESVDAEPSDTGVSSDQLPPTQGGPLLTWLESGAYTSWAAESGLHASTGPHFGDVRTFVNDALDASLAAGNTEHPMGSAAVKELYGNGSNVRGWSVMVKTESGTGGDRWWWYERYDGSVFASSQGSNVCVPCHVDGNDFFQSPYPLQ